MKGRRGEVSGDAVRIWHVLDQALPKLRETRRGMEDAGCEELAEELADVIEKAEARYDGAEGEVVRLLDGGWEEPQW